MKNNILIYAELILVILAFPIFFLFGKVFTAKESFILSMFAYWILIGVSTVFLLFNNNDLSRKLKSYFIKPKRKWLLLLNFIPAVAVFFVTFLLNISKLNLGLIFTFGMIAIFNGTIGEFFLARDCSIKIF